MAIAEPKISHSIIKALEDGASSTKVENSAKVVASYNNLRSWLKRRYPDLSLKALDNGGLKGDKRVKFAKQLEELDATQDIEVLYRAMQVQEQIKRAPEDVLKQVGVNLENVQAEIIRIDEVSVGLPQPAKEFGFHDILAYLDSLCESEFTLHNTFAELTKSSEMKTLTETKVCLRAFGGKSDEKKPAFEAIQESFARDRKIGRIERMVILGDVGSGKSEALSQIQKQVADRTRDLHVEFDQDNKKVFANEEDENNFVVPIYINLANLYGGNTVESLIRDEFNRHFDLAATQSEFSTEQAPELLRNYKCLLLFDALDARIADRDALQQIRQFMEQNSQEQYVITCRHSSYRNQLGTIDTMFVDDLDEKQTKKILGQRRYATLSSSLRQLANNRLMLRVILDLSPNDKASLENKGQLIQQFTQRRLRNAYVSESSPILEEEIAAVLLEHIAYKMHRDHVHFYTDRELMLVVKGYLDEWHERYHWREVVQALQQTGMLIPRGKRRWAFRDRITKAYYAAAAIEHDANLLEPVMTEISAIWWRDVFEILVGLVYDPTRLFFDIMDRDSLTAAYLAEYRKLSSKVTDAIINTLIAQMEQKGTLERKRIAVYLGEHNHQKAAEALIKALHREHASNVVQAIARAIWRWSSRKSPENIRKAEENILNTSTIKLESFYELLQAFDELAIRRGQNQPIDTSVLVDRMVDTENSRLCRGLSAIGLGFAPNTDVINELFEIGMSETENDFVAWCAIDTLCQIGWPVLESKATDIFNQPEPENGSSSKSRVRATYLLGEICSGKQTRNLLLNRALHDDNPAVRGFAVDALLALDLPDARDHIEQLLSNEENAVVIRKCAEALTQIGMVSSLPVLEAQLYNIHTHTRWHLREAINEIRSRNGIE